MPNSAVLEGQFVHLHFVDEKYHEQHSQLLHKHDDALEPVSYTHLTLPTICSV